MSPKTLRTVLCFQYEDEEIDYPLLVLSHARINNAGATTVYEWHINHEYSKKLRESKGVFNVPSFGLWQRINECAMDALLCWPEIEVTGSKPFYIYTVAGWFNGSWSQKICYRRNFGNSHRFGREPTIVPPFVQDVNAITHSWKFVDSSRASRNAMLDGIQKTGGNLLYLPSEHPLTGFEKDIPHLRRDDNVPSRNQQLFKQR